MLLAYIYNSTHHSPGPILNNKPCMLSMENDGKCFSALSYVGDICLLTICEGTSTVLGVGYGVLNSVLCWLWYRMSRWWSMAKSISALGKDCCMVPCKSVNN